MYFGQHLGDVMIHLGESHLFGLNREGKATSVKVIRGRTYVQMESALGDPWAKF